MEEAEKYEQRQAVHRKAAGMPVQQGFMQYSMSCKSTGGTACDFETLINSNAEFLAFFQIPQAKMY